MSQPGAEPPSENISTIGRRPTLVVEVAPRRPWHPAVVPIAVVRYTMAFGLVIFLFGAAGAIADRQSMIRYAESALDTWWKMAGFVCASLLLGTERVSAALRRRVTRG